VKKELSHRQIMNRIYKDISGFEIPKNDTALIRQSKGSPIYGEINHQALNKLIDYLALTENDVFYDLGSGVGKVVLHVAMCSPVKKAVGVELSLARFHDARNALTRALDFMPELKKRVDFVHDDLQNVDLKKASVIYSCSTAFSQKFMNLLVKNLAIYKHNFRLLSLQELPEQKHFKLINTIPLDMSWMRHCPVHIYERQLRS
jgi:SAM-dependent methyltransferase